jgi:hypothetical protein
MCDYIAGELILCFPKVDTAAQQLMEDIRGGLIEHVSYLESLEQKLARLSLTPDDDLEFQFHRVAVPAGEEHWKVTYLQFFYKHKLLEALGTEQLTPQFRAALSRSDYQFTAAPNSILSLASTPLGREAVKAVNFTFSKFHTQYKKLIGIPAELPSDLGQITITIVDSGISDDVNFQPADKRNFVDPEHPTEVTDEHGHGTVIALMLRDLAPNAHLVVYKVADASGRVSEWDTLAALAVCAKVHVINLSLQFGLENRVCEVCGRESHRSRSAVFENMVGQFEKRRSRSLLIGAAGNDGLDRLAFPARFGTLLAIGAINSKGELSRESNFGKQYIEAGTQDSRFVCPGGDDATDPPETVGSFGKKDALYWHGTSFAAAYASGVAANLLARYAGQDRKYDAILNELRKNVSKTLVDYDNNKEGYGHGLMRLTD